MQVRSVDGSRVGYASLVDNFGAVIEWNFSEGQKQYCWKEEYEVIYDKPERVRLTSGEKAGYVGEIIGLPTIDTVTVAWYNENVISTESVGDFKFIVDDTYRVMIAVLVEVRAENLREALDIAETSVKSGSDDNDFYKLVATKTMGKRYEHDQG